MWCKEEAESDLRAKKKSVITLGGRVPGTTKAEVLNPELTTRDAKYRRKRNKVDSTRRKVVQVAPPRSGQSYNPEFESHQEVLGMAVAAELRRKEAEDEEKIPLARGMSKSTLDILKADDTSDEDSDSDSDDAGGGRGAVNEVVKRESKKTRAERNRQRRHKSRLVQIAKAKKEKALMNEIEEVKVSRMGCGVGRSKRRNKNNKSMDALYSTLSTRFLSCPPSESQAQDAQRRVDQAGASVNQEEAQGGKGFESRRLRFGGEGVVCQPQEGGVYTGRSD